MISNLDLYSEIISGFQKIIEDGMISVGLSSYGKMSKQIFSRYDAGATVVARYVKETGTGNSDGSSWANASGDIQAVVNGINDASKDKIYVVLAASGTYKPNASYSMKNHVALVGGFMADSYDHAGETRLDANNDKRVFNNNGLDSTALLYGVVVTNGNSTDGGGMYNSSSSPTLINVTFSGNKGTGKFSGGGGMYNSSSSPTLINVTFSGNKGTGKFSGGGGMYNSSSSPTLINVTFSDNQSQSGGGMYNSSSSPTLINVTFSGNEAAGGGNSVGGGVTSYYSSITLINVTFSGNTASRGSGIYHHGQGDRLTLINTILWNSDNGNIYLDNTSSNTEIIDLYYSVIEGGTTPSTTASGIRLRNADTNTYHVNINSEEVIAGDPELGPLADNGGEVTTISIGNNSSAKDKGVYVRREANLYYSKNNIDWYSDLDLTTQKNLPNNADDLTATDARGYSRIGRPDMGAYEEGGTAP